MTAIEHTHFTIARKFDTSPAHAFRFWADPALKDRWTGCHPDWVVEKDDWDFRPGGTETKHLRTPGGEVQTFTAHYLDIVPPERIIYAYEMSFGGQRLSASLVTIILRASGQKTLMSFTEQVAILDGGTSAIDMRLQGTEQVLDILAGILAQDETA